MIYPINDLLEHAGILGMKWGIRKNKPGNSISKGEVAKKPKLKESEDHIKMMQIRKKKLSELSNAEIQFVNNRINMQIQYKQLTTSKWEGRKKAAAGLVGKALINVGKAAWQEQVKKSGGTQAALKQILSTTKKS